jgi:poly [ADP-ribose] polymerase
MPKTYRLANAPKFATKFSIVSKAVLQKTDVKNNNNKYYAIELHSAKSAFRVFTHYGRTDDLESNPDAGVKEVRVFDTLPEAEQCYNAIFKQKTGKSKGYKELSLASSKIGSQQARGESVGEIDDETLAKVKTKTKKKVAKSKVDLSQPVKALVDYIYCEATNALTKTVNAKITANGIETPLGVLTLGQVEKGQAALDKIDQELKKKKKTNLDELSSDFFTLIPHRIGRARSAIEAAVIRDAQTVVEKNETLQLMRDMLSVSGGDEGNVLYDGTIADQYLALGCKLEVVTSKPRPLHCQSLQSCSSKRTGCVQRVCW